MSGGCAPGGHGGQEHQPWNLVTEDEILALLGTIQRKSSWLNKWQQLAAFIRPHEPDWRAYADPSKYKAPVIMEVHPHLAQHGGQIRMIEGLLKLGFVINGSDGCTFVLNHKHASEQLEKLRTEKKRQRGILGHAGRRESKEKQHVTWQMPKDSSRAPRTPASRGTDPIPSPASPLPSAALGHQQALQPSQGSQQAPDTKLEVASLLSVSASCEGASYCDTSTSGGDEASDPNTVETRHVTDYLKEQVRELTRQVRILRAAALSSTTKPVVPCIIHYNYSAPTVGHHPVRLVVNYLDPDLAPYRVAIQLKSLNGTDGWYSPPCSIIDHQYVVFLAPPNPPGSYPVTLFGTSETGRLLKYCQSTWLEYKVTPEDTKSGEDSKPETSQWQKDARSVSLTNTSGIARTSPHGPRTTRQGSASDIRERQSCMKGSRRPKPDRRSSVTSGTSSAAPRNPPYHALGPNFPVRSQSVFAQPSPSSSAPLPLQAPPSPSKASAPLAVPAAVKPEADPAQAKHEVSLSLQHRREGITHHQINEHNALNVIPLCQGDLSEGPDTVDPTSDLKSHSEMKSEFTSDIAEEEQAEDDDDEVWQTRQFRALLPSREPDAEHPPLTKEMLELLTLGHGFDKEEIVRSFASRSIEASMKAVNFMTSKGTRSGGSLRSTSPVYPIVVASLDLQSTTSPTRSLSTVQPRQPLNGGTHNTNSASSSASTSTYSGRELAKARHPGSVDLTTDSSPLYARGFSASCESEEQASQAAQSDSGAPCFLAATTPPSCYSPAAGSGSLGVGFAMDGLSASYPSRLTRAKSSTFDKDSRDSLRLSSTERTSGHSVRPQTPLSQLHYMHPLSQQSPPSTSRPPSGRASSANTPVSQNTSLSTSP
ncbi:hypothetical protein DIPPA_22346 [Diplonema papillatum]|nr:hypothetical protein DIPPA_22346 [Diplonema papillatum]|eukprot:gene11135-17116_t